VISLTLNIKAGTTTESFYGSDVMTRWTPAKFSQYPSVLAFIF